MTQVTRWTALSILAVFAMTILLPTAAMASRSSTQKNKNLWRNLAIGSGVVAGYGLLHHNGTATAVGLAGAGYSAYRYEQERKKQSAHSRWRSRYHHHYYRHR